MILTLFIVFISSLILVWKGVLGHYVGFTLMASSLGAMIWNRIRTFQLKRNIRADTRNRKAKWGGELTVVSGLSSATGSSCRLFITRYDELIVEDPISERVIPLDEIERMVLLYGKTLESMNDVQIGEASGFQSVPRLYHVRAWIARNPRSRKQLFLAIRFQKPLTVAEYSEMAVFSDIRQMGNLHAFRLRPEVAVRTAVLPRKVNKKIPHHLVAAVNPSLDHRHRRDGARQDVIPNRFVERVEQNEGILSSDKMQSNQIKGYDTRYPNILLSRERGRDERKQSTGPFSLQDDELTISTSERGDRSTSEERRRTGGDGLESVMRVIRESKLDNMTIAPSFDVSVNQDDGNNNLSDDNNEKKVEEERS